MHRIMNILGTVRLQRFPRIPRFVHSSRETALPRRMSPCASSTPAHSNLPALDLPDLATRAVTLSEPFQKGQFNLINLGCYLGDENDKAKQTRAAIEFFQHFNVIPTNSFDVSCTCGAVMTAESHNRGLLGFRWVCRNNQCPRYNLKVSPLKNTLLSLLIRNRGDFNVECVLKILTCWIYKMQPNEAAAHCECDPRTVRTWYRHFMKVARVAEGHDQVKIGGSTDVVELDESQLFQRKYNENEGRPIKGPGSSATNSEWCIVGGISRITKKRFVVRAISTERESLLREIAARVNEDSFIITDEKKAYLACPTRFNCKRDATVTVSPENAVVPGLDPKLRINYIRPWAEKRILVPSEDVDPEKEVEIKLHTHTVTNMWRDLNQHVQTMKGKENSDRFEVDDCIGDWIYRKNTFEEGGRVDCMDRGEHMRRFLQDVCRVYPGPFKNGIQDRRENCLCDECLAKAASNNKLT